MTLTHKALYDAFRTRASMIHDLITFSYSTKHLGISEESITGITLVELERSLLPHLITRKFNKREESSQSGSDWLWTIGRRGRWFSLLIQAKLVRPARKSLHGLHHRNGAQLDLLAGLPDLSSLKPAEIRRPHRLSAGHPDQRRSSVQ